MKSIYKYFIVFLVGLLLGLLLGKQFTKQKIVEIPVEIIDTTYIEKERIIEKTIPVYIKDTIIKIDSIIITDTDTLVLLPLIYKLYNDTISTDSTTINLSISHHGILSEIDSIKLNYNYQPTFQCPKPKIKKFGIDVTLGLGIGYGYGMGSPNTGSPYAGITLVIGPSYRITK